MQTAGQKWHMKNLHTCKHTYSPYPLSPSVLHPLLFHSTNSKYLQIHIQIGTLPCLNRWVRLLIGFIRMSLLDRMDSRGQETMDRLPKEGSGGMQKTHGDSKPYYLCLDDSSSSRNQYSLTGSRGTGPAPGSGYLQTIHYGWEEECKDGKIRGGERKRRQGQSQRRGMRGWKTQEGGRRKKRGWEQEGDEGEDCSRAARLAAVCFVVAAQLPRCAWVLLFLQCGCNVYFRLRERMQALTAIKIKLSSSLPPSLSLFSRLQHHFFPSLLHPSRGSCCRLLSYLSSL